MVTLGRVVDHNEYEDPQTLSGSTSEISEILEAVSNRRNAHPRGGQTLLLRDLIMHHWPREWHQILFLRNDISLSESHQSTVPLK